MSAVPKLRFNQGDGSDFPDWEEVNFGDKIISITNGTTEPQVSDRTNYPVTRIETISNRTINHDKVGYLVEQPDDKYIIVKGDILFSHINSVTHIGKTALYEGEDGALFHGMNLLLIRVGSGMNYKFVFYLLNHSSFQREVRRKTKESVSQASINTSDIRTIRCWVPDIAEQQKIASFLSSVDKKIDLLRQKKDALELYKKGLMQKIFSQEIRFKQDDGSDFPDWEEVALGDVFVERSERGHGDKQLLGVTLSKGVVRASEIEKIDRSSSDLSNYKYVKMGDIAYNSMRMWQGASGASSYNGIVSPAYTVITPLADNETKFWAYLFKYPEMIKVFERHSQGLTSDTWNLKFKALSTIKVLRPSGEEQKRIAVFFASIDAKIEKFSSQIEQMETFKKGLLQQMFV